MPGIFWLVPAACVVTIAFAIWLIITTLKRSTGTPEMAAGNKHALFPTKEDRLSWNSVSQHGSWRSFTQIPSEPAWRGAARFDSSRKAAWINCGKYGRIFRSG